MFGTLVQSAGLFSILNGIWYSQSILSYIGIVVFVIGFQVGSGGCCYLFAAEVLPPVGVSFVTSILWTLGITTVKLAPFLSHKYSENAIIIFYCVVCLLIFFVLDIFEIETKDKSDVKIIEEYKSKKYRFMDFS